MKKCLALLLLLGIVPAWATPKLDGGPFQGEVLESINAGSYSYLRLKTKDGEVWAATMLSNYPKGTKVQLHDPMLMTNFESRALNKTFDEIVFASAVSTETGRRLPSPAQQMAAAHSGTSKQDTQRRRREDPPRPQGQRHGPSPRFTRSATKLKGKPVAVRGTVVKVSSNIMDRNWIHLRDGSGSAADSDQRRAHDHGPEADRQDR